MKLIYSSFIRWLFLLVVLILSACSQRHQATASFSAKDLKALPSHYAEVKNGRIEYYRFGSGSPIILINGYMTDVSGWNQEFLTALARQHDVIVLNNRNVGRSIIQSPHYESKDLANDTYQLIQELGLKKPAVLGISMGGMIAQQLAVLHTDKIGPLILINTAIAGKSAIHPSPTVEEQMMEIPKNKLSRYVTAVQLFFPAAWKMQMAYTLATDRFQPLNYKEIEPATIISKQRELVLRWINDDATEKKISRLTMPVLILNGEADIVIPPMNSVVLANAIPHARLIRWKQGGHAMIYQYPEQIASRVTDFIRESA
jgi:pimeloyl-ACP methyl ester carboxylesterase